MPEFIWTWDILGLGDEQENIIQKFLWTSVKTVTGDMEIFEYPGMQDNVYAIPLALKVGADFVGDDYSKAKEKLVKIHLEKILIDGYQAWFDYIMKYRAGSDTPREFNLIDMELREIQKDRQDRENLAKLGIKMPKSGDDALV